MTSGTQSYKNCVSKSVSWTLDTKSKSSNRAIAYFPFLAASAAFLALVIIK